MPTAKTFELKLTELLNDSPVLQGILAKDSHGNLEIHPYVANPVNDRYPQLVWNYHLGESEEALPSEHATLVCTGYMTKTSGETALPLKKILDEVDNIINNNSQIFWEINEEENYGLRPVQIKRTNGLHGYDGRAEVFFRTATFKVVKDDDRANYNVDYLTWNPEV